ncbi:hypothetical protein [Aureivirga sp. CE67]|uniref:hypothetical protein n=1 Tax=Aureivirga sp. CE67 TaxID=1788983 RepID=UPI0018CBA347|nr:hypothetical protein [Aureivirga sp. CE67]
MRKTLIILFLFSIKFCNSQSKTNLSKLLWESVNSCYKMIENGSDEDYGMDLNKIDDAKNGYLQISGSWPTCGCSCTSTVAAFKNLQGKYTLIQTDEEPCAWKKSIHSNKDLKSIFPENFGIQSFGAKVNSENVSFPYFYLSIDIPRYGTDMKVELFTIPFGLKNEGNQLISYGYGNFKERKYLHGISTIVNSIKDQNTLNHLVSGNFNKIQIEDLKIIQEEIGDDDSRFDNLGELQKYLKELKEIYIVYNQLETTSLVFGWDKKSSRFYIKSKGKNKTKTSFLEFLQNHAYWSPVC